MKSVICLTLFTLGYVVAAPQKIQLNLEQTMRMANNVLECVRETHVDFSALLRIRNKEYLDSKEEKDFISCAFFKFNVASKEGVVDGDSIIAIYPDSVDKSALKAVIDQCKVQVESIKKTKEKLFAFFKCYQKNVPVHLDY